MVNKFTLIAVFCFGLLFFFQLRGFGQENNNKDKTENLITGAGTYNNAPQIITYPTPGNLETSPDFTVKVNDTDVWTERVGSGGMENLNMARFACSGQVTIKITASSNIRAYVIRPKNRDIVANVNGRELSFTIPGPQKLYIEIDSLPHLAIFADAPETNIPDRNDENVVYYGPGYYEEDEINPISNQTIYIAPGAYVKANIRGDSLKNVKIAGRGILHGTIKIKNTTNLVVDGIYMRHNSHGWTNTLTNCHNSTYHNVKVFAYKTVWGTDGINPVSCINFVIDDCFIRTRDDCISIKSSDKVHKTDSITVINSVMVGWSHADGVTLGFNIDGLMQNVLVKNCDILYARGQGHTGGHSAFSIVCDNTGNVRNIRFEDIRVEENIEIKNLELIVTEGQRYGTNNPPGRIEGVYLKHIRWENEDKPFVIAGIPFDNHQVVDVTFDSCYAGDKLLTNLKDADFQVEFARDIKFIPSTKMKGRSLSNE